MALLIKVRRRNAIMTLANTMAANRMAGRAPCVKSRSEAGDDQNADGLPVGGDTRPGSISIN
jgi:hypothetical protein